MSEFIKVCQLKDIEPDTGVCALVNGKQIALFRPVATGAVYAIGNYDPIGKANVLSRGLTADVKGYLTVASPLYKQHYVLESGKCLEDETVSVPTYPVKVENEQVWVAA